MIHPIRFLCHLTLLLIATYCNGENIRTNETAGVCSVGEIDVHWNVLHYTSKVDHENKPCITLGFITAVPITWKLVFKEAKSLYMEKFVEFKSLSDHKCTLRGSENFCQRFEIKFYAIIECKQKRNITLKFSTTNGIEDHDTEVQLGFSGSSANECSESLGKVSDKKKQ